jgi:hypothetical protein
MEWRGWRPRNIRSTADCAIGLRCCVVLNEEQQIFDLSCYLMSEEITLEDSSYDSEQPMSAGIASKYLGKDPALNNYNDQVKFEVFYVKKPWRCSFP